MFGCKYEIGDSETIYVPYCANFFARKGQILCLKLVSLTHSFFTSVGTARGQGIIRVVVIVVLVDDVVVTFSDIHIFFKAHKTQILTFWAW